MSKINTGFGKLESGELEYAKTYIVDGTTVITNPSDLQYLDAGWKFIRDNQPEGDPDEGYHWEKDGYTQNDTEIFNAWKQVQDTPVVYRYSKLKLITASKKYEVWTDLKAFIQEFGIEDEWNACQYLQSDDPTFVQAKTAIIQRGKVSEELITIILMESIDV